MHHIITRNLARFGCVSLTALAIACGSDDTGSNENNATTAGQTATSPTAGKSGSTSTLPTAGKTSTTPSAGSMSASTAGRASGSAGHANDEDAGVMPTAGTGSHAGSGGSAAAGHAGTSSGAAGSGAGGGATFTQVYAMFKTNCATSTCHGSATNPGDMLSMKDQATAYMDLVGVASVSCTGEKRVVAGDPAKSELVHTLDRTMIGSCRNTPKMPDNKPKLGQADIDLVTSWIMAGAQNN
jgi:hypothetical protein